MESTVAAREYNSLQSYNMRLLNILALALATVACLAQEESAHNGHMGETKSDMEDKKVQDVNIPHHVVKPGCPLISKARWPGDSCAPPDTPIIVNHVADKCPCREMKTAKIVDKLPAGEPAPCPCQQASSHSVTHMLRGDSSK